MPTGSLIAAYGVMERLRAAWLRLLSSLWFVPMLVVLTCLGLALLLIDANRWVEADLAASWPRLFGAGADGGRSMLSAIATSMITVAGVVLSVTIVALSQASTQYSPRVLRNFMADRPTQVVLGIFVGVFVYCLVVLRTVRSEDENGGFLPSVAVLGGMVLALLGVIALVYYIHHVAASIQAASIVERIHDETLAAIDRLFPQPVERTAPHAAQGDEAVPDCPHVVCSAETGYMVAIDTRSLMRHTRRTDRVACIAVRTGDFVIEGRPLVRLSGSRALRVPEVKSVRRLFTIGQQRTVDQDASFGFQQLVDIAVKALSPGINDPTTATMCIDRLGALLIRLAQRETACPQRSDGHRVRVVAPGPGFAEIVSLALDPIARHARGDDAVLNRLVDALVGLEHCTRDAGRRRALRQRLARVRASADSAAPDDPCTKALHERCRALELALHA